MTAHLHALSSRKTSCQTARLALALAWLGLAAPGCSQAQEAPAPTAQRVAAAGSGTTTDQAKGTRMWMTANGQRFAFTLADTAAARAFAARLPMTLDMSDLNANEKEADLPAPLPSNPSRPGTIRQGDLMLWGKDTVVIFYQTFDSPYAYTRLGQVNDPSGLARALGRSGVQVQFSAQP